VNRRAGVAAAILVSAIFFVIRFGIRVLSTEATPPTSTVVGHSRSTPLEPPSPSFLKSEANAKLMVLASEAREAKDTHSAIFAYAAQEALRKEDCGGATNAMARASAAMAKESRAQGALEGARRSLSAYCATVTD
jgi:hypothetical protein